MFPEAYDKETGSELLKTLGPIFFSMWMIQ